MIFFTSIVPVVAVIVWCEVNLVKCGDMDLEFWQRDPKFDFRRVNEIKKHKIADFKDVAVSAKALLEKHLAKVRSHRRPKLEITQGYDSNPQRHERHHNNREKPRWPKPKIQPTNSIKHKNYSNKQLEDVKTTRSNQKKRTKKKETEIDVELQTTKLTPVYLRQKTAEKPKKYLREKVPSRASTMKDKYKERKAALKTQKRAGRKEQEPKPDPLSGLSSYLNPYSISKHLDDLLCKFPNADITREVIGKTLSYHDIILLKITEKKSDLDSYFRADDVNKFAEEGPQKKIVFIVHGLSVMGIFEISCLTTAMDFVDLLGYYLLHLDKFDIFLVPMANPDGVLNNFNGNSYWNKNLSPQKACAGVALDRNFDIAWNETRIMSSCSQQYPGTYPFSEPESQAVREVIHRHSTKIVAYFHVHAGTCNSNVFKGDAVLYPKGYTEIQSEDDKYIDLKGEIDEAMQLAGFRVISVTVDTLYSWYGKITGASVDYATAIYGIPYAMELVMQPYSDDDHQDAALTEIWKRVINVTLCNIYRNAGK